MNNTTQLTELYEKLFSVGSLERNIMIYIVTYLGYLSMISILNGLQNIYFYAVIPAYSLILSKIFIKYLFSERDDEFYCIRRLLALHIVENLIIIFLLLINYFAILIYPVGRETLALILIGMIIIENIIFIPTLYSGEKTGNILTVTKTVILLVLFSFVLKTHILTSLIGTTIAFIIANLSVHMINNESKKFSREGVFEYLRGYIDAWLLNNPEKLDSLIYRNSLLLKIPVDQIVFPGIYRRTANLIVPYFHFGPFKNVGSSRFPSVAGETIYIKNGFLTGVFHGPSTHDRDLASNSEMEHVLNIITKYNTPIIFHEVSDIGEVRNGKARVKFIRLGESILLFLEYEEMEDIPYEIVETLKNIGGKLGYSQVIVVDSHNSLISKNYSLKKEDISKILKTGIEALEEAKTSILQRFKAGVEKIELPGISLREGLGGNGIYILMIETLTKRNGILIIDSNNLHPSFKKKLEEELIGKYFDSLVITSTDTHEVTAQELTEGGYRILGENDRLNEYIIDAISKASNKLLNKLKECDGHVYSTSVEARVIGYNLLDKLAQMTLKSFEYMKRVFSFFTIPAAVIVTLALLIT